MTATEQTSLTLTERRARVLGPAYRLFYREPVEIVRGAGTRLFDVDGVEYLDAYNNVPSVGHCHPKVVEAQSRQAATLNTHTRYLGHALVDYAERLVATFPAELSNVMFTCTGSEAVDLALRVARYTSKGTGVIVTENAYHGTTAAAAAVSPSLGAAMQLGPDVRVVPAPRTAAGVDTAEVFAAGVRRALDDLERCGHGVAALLTDTIFSSDGVRPGLSPFLGPAVDAVRQAGGVFVADEVQPGFGRTGTGMWGFERHRVVPDLVVMGKPMGNGMPIAALVARPELLARFGTDIRYFNTFGGNPVAIAAANAVLDVIEDEDLVTNASTVGRFLLDGLRDIAARHDALGEVRGVGLFLAVDALGHDGSPDSRVADALVNLYRRHRVLVGTAGKGNTAIKIRPPLPFSIADAERFLDITDALLPELDAYLDEGRSA
ncbi:aspartate aminotransferase family protein [Rhodococcoides fascians]|uniref:aspartate aminotransferase family protein n=1 Tax=Rhodococcoides fascians TaxID=1828 RepID=UPI000566E8DA|nr:aspartate aminotransferase family protein [Rhodococcus fascians]